MTENKLVQFINKYDNNDWPFSAAYVCEELISVTSSAFDVYKCAEQFRLCGRYKEASKLLEKINLNSIPEKGRYQYWLSLGILYEESYQINLAMAA